MSASPQEPSYNNRERRHHTPTQSRAEFRPRPTEPLNVRHGSTPLNQIVHQEPSYNNRERPHHTPPQTRAEFRPRPTKPPKSHVRVRVPTRRSEASIPVIPEEGVTTFFESNVSEWAARPHTHGRLVSFGLPVDDADILLKGFVKDVEASSLSDPASHSYHALDRFSQPLESTSIDIIYSTIFFSWASKTDNQTRLEEELGVHKSTLGFLKRLTKATSRTFPADEFQMARAMHRKIIMHVGPTNSGKTHHALRALAAAESGVYCGPLRLLAHEIWHRLNTGQIVPLGVEEDAPSDSKGRGNPKYARLCNMIVDHNARLLSCTVEMLSFLRRSDVAVVDEIQMIADPDRGSGWLNAVLGIRAKEVHLCGEETAVPIVEALLEHTGDELEVRRYERLTPLTVEEKSLGGDLTKIQKGDCIVTFNRSSIFAIKKAVEELTGMRCAVVYGRLPPEVRSEQATLFNDPDSGYDVIIGSDAIGMGLNLKIKRVIFAATSKFDGHDLSPLSVSSVKQIAGRAGRFGLHEAQSDLGGTTTTLFDEDLPHLAHCVATPYTPLPYARIGYNEQLVTQVLSVLPPGTPMNVVLSASKYIGRLPSHVRYANQEQLTTACAFLDNQWRNMTNADKVSVLYAPIPWRDHHTVDIIRRLLIQQASGDSVNFMKAIEGTGFIEKMEEMERRMELEAQGMRIRLHGMAFTMLQMEAFHKVMVLYLWMSFRNPIVYSESEIVTPIKERLERVLNWCLDGMSKMLATRENLRSVKPPTPVKTTGHKVIPQAPKERKQYPPLKPKEIPVEL
ncbi:P-loop containing nucleoside triphosphate hydrolase protein [Flammula alnicola]|nr:P-loop containing nucleoside triphosphate hydrolase protein [Flammula alnicola]